MKPSRMLFAVALMTIANLGCATGGEPWQRSSRTVGEVTAAGRHYTAALYEGRTAEIWAHTSPELRNVLHDEARLALLRAQIQARFGTETAVVHESVATAWSTEGRSGFARPAYERWARFSGSNERMFLRWVFDRNDEIFEITFVPESLVAK